MPLEQSAVNGESMDSSGDGLGTFLFTSESVGEGHPGKKIPFFYMTFLFYSGPKSKMAASMKIDLEMNAFASVSVML